MVAKASRVVNLYINAIDVGRLEKLRSGELKFFYTDDWLMMPGARPISLSLPLVDIKYSGQKVYNYFDNLLPDNPNLRKRIQAKFQLSSDHPFDLLKAIGKDCVGAIQLGIEDDVKFKKNIQYQPLTNKELAERLKNTNSAPLGMYDDDEDFRISLAGVQEKSAFLYHNNKWNIPVGQTPTTHIFKLPIGTIQHQQLDLSDSCENEWLCSKIANAFGLSSANSEILQIEDVKVLSVERFDRQLANDKSWIMRLPQEDFCQALGISPALKYQSDSGPGIKDILNILLTSNNPDKNRNTFFKAQILFWLLAAIDGHAKNFSIFIKPGGSFELTPLYDILSAYPFIEQKQLSERKIKMAMALKGKNIHYKWYECKRSHFVETAKQSGFSAKNAEYLLDEMLSKVEEVINIVESELPQNFNMKIATAIFNGMRLMKNKLLQ